MSLDEQNWRLCWFHTNYFIREYLFSTWLTSFESRYFKLSVHIFLMSFEASICGDSACFIYVSLKRRDKAHHLFSLFYKITLFFNPLRFQMLPYSDLYNQKCSIFSYFQSSCKKRDWCGLRPQRVILLKQVAANIDSVWKWWPHCFRHTAPGTHCRTSTINMGAELNIRRIHTLNRVRELAVRYRKAVQQM